MLVQRGEKTKLIRLQKQHVLEIYCYGMDIKFFFSSFEWMYNSSKGALYLSHLSLQFWSWNIIEVAVVSSSPCIPLHDNVWDVQRATSSVSALAKRGRQLRRRVVTAGFLCRIKNKAIQSDINQSAMSQMMTIGPSFPNLSSQICLWEWQY